MLVEFNVENFKSFRGEQVVSFVSSKRYDSEQYRDNIIENIPKAGSLVKSNFIYGANASGKSNIIDAASAMKQIVCSSLRFNPDQKLPVKPFKLDKISRNKGTTFEVSLVIEGTLYIYGFEVDEKEFISEWLYYYPKGRQREVFSREGLEVKVNKEIKLSKKVQEGISPNVCFLSWAGKWETSVFRKVFDWFADKLVVVKHPRFSGNFTNKMALDESLRSEIVKQLSEADVGITDLRIIEREIDEGSFNFPDDMPEELQERFISDFKRKPLFTHSGEIGGEFEWEEESEGTKAFYGFCGPLIDIINNDKTLFIDEIEQSIHPLLMEKVLRYFHTRSRNAQLFAATHNTYLLRNDTNVVRRDQIWFVEKDENGISSVFPLSDFKQRKGNSIEDRYLNGRFGAVPVLSDF
ncbi:AAA family ATPase [Sedimentisphaera salicampi]|uniref:AAA family ATPase n=1 Tax=Sedimentisphaera salicampi TaxID=1941349 RepID=UPI000B9BB93F|nr:ATP-binding protein [Sedimentisphaera salicampi]OXU15195.1 putative ATPase [Sedimentisphaera salicampi]